MHPRLAALVVAVFVVVAGLARPAKPADRPEPPSQVIRPVVVPQPVPSKVSMAKLEALEAALGRWEAKATPLRSLAEEISARLCQPGGSETDRQKSRAEIDELRDQGYRFYEKTHTTYRPHEYAVLYAMMDILREELKGRKAPDLAKFWLSRGELFVMIDNILDRRTVKETSVPLLRHDSFFNQEQFTLTSFLDAYEAPGLGGLNVIGVFRMAKPGEKNMIPVMLKETVRTERSTLLAEIRTKNDLTFNTQVLAQKETKRRAGIVFVGAIISLQTHTDAISVAERWAEEPVRVTWRHAAYSSKTLFEPKGDEEGISVESRSVTRGFASPREQAAIPFFRKGKYQIFPLPY